ncbi:MAG TPA: histidine phosphatase family protein, partial [Clostridia bacterium]|nr:histidine phosphatase family protein [Clostridia bacterium]
FFSWESLGNIPQTFPGEEKREKTPAEQHDPELTPLGQKQAGLLGERLKLQKFDAIFSSTLIRAILTAHEVSTRQPGHRMPIEPIHDLVETGTPWDYSGHSVQALQSRGAKVLAPRFIQGDAEDWITAEKLDEQEAHLKRAQRCIHYFKDRFQQGEKILVVAHGSFNTYLIRAALALNNTNDFNFCQENTALTKVKYFLDGEARLSYSNDTSHLYAENKHLTFSL